MSYDILTVSSLFIRTGIGTSLASISPITTMLMFFPINTALPLGIISVGASVGMMIFPPLTEFFIDIYGWRGAILLFAAISANVCVLGALIQPHSTGYAACADHQNERPLSESSCQRAAPRDCCTNCAKSICKVMSFDIFMHEPRFIVFTFVMFTVGIIYSAWMIYLVPHAIARGIDNQSATFLSSAGGIGTLVGRILHGPILHRGYVKAVQLFILLGFVNFLSLMLDYVVSDNYTGLLLLAFANGLSLGTMSVLFIQTAQQVLDEDLYVKGWGAMDVFFSVGELCGGAFAGMLK